MSPELLEVLMPARWPLVALVSARVVGLMLVAPLWSMQSVPLGVRAAMAMVITVLLLPLIPESVEPVAAGPLSVLALATELLLGVALGLAAAVFLHALTVAAEVVSLQMGLSFGAAFSGDTGAGTPGIGQFYHLFALGTFAVLGGHLLLLVTLGMSLQMLPPGAPLALDVGGPVLLGMLGSLFRIAVQVAAPVMVALLVTNLALAVLNRAVPQLHTMMVAVPLTVAVGFLVIGATLPFTASLLARWVHGLEGSLGELIGSLVPAGPGER